MVEEYNTISQFTSWAWVRSGRGRSSRACFAVRDLMLSFGAPEVDLDDHKDSILEYLEGALVDKSAPAVGTKRSANAAGKSPAKPKRVFQYKRAKEAAAGEGSKPVFQKDALDSDSDGEAPAGEAPGEVQNQFPDMSDIRYDSDVGRLAMQALKDMEEEAKSAKSSPPSAPPAAKSTPPSAPAADADMPDLASDEADDDAAGDKPAAVDADMPDLAEDDADVVAAFLGTAPTKSVGTSPAKSLSKSVVHAIMMSPATSPGPSRPVGVRSSSVSGDVGSEFDVIMRDADGMFVVGDGLPTREQFLAQAEKSKRLVEQFAAFKEEHAASEKLIDSWYNSPAFFVEAKEALDRAEAAMADVDKALEAHKTKVQGRLQFFMSMMTDDDLPADKVARYEADKAGLLAQLTPEALESKRQALAADAEAKLQEAKAAFEAAAAKKERFGKTRALLVDLPHLAPLMTHGHPLRPVNKKVSKGKKGSGSGAGGSGSGAAGGPVDLPPLQDPAPLLAEAHQLTAEQWAAIADRLTDEALGTCYGPADGKMYTCCCQQCKRPKPDDGPVLHPATPCCRTLNLVINHKGDVLDDMIIFWDIKSDRTEASGPKGFGNSAAKPKRYFNPVDKPKKKDMTHKSYVAEVLLAVQESPESRPHCTNSALPVMYPPEVEQQLKEAALVNKDAVKKWFKDQNKLEADSGLYNGLVAFHPDVYLDAACTQYNPQNKFAVWMLPEMAAVNADSIPASLVEKFPTFKLQAESILKPTDRVEKSTMASLFGKVGYDPVPFALDEGFSKSQGNPISKSIYQVDYRFKGRLITKRFSNAGVPQAVVDLANQLATKGCYLALDIFLEKGRTLDMEDVQSILDKGYTAPPSGEYLETGLDGLDDVDDVVDGNDVDTEEED